MNVEPVHPVPDQLAACEVDEMQLLTLGKESRVALSEQDFVAFTDSLGCAFNPNPALEDALAEAKKSVRRV